MATEIKLPSLGEGVESGDVLEIYVKVGDVVKFEQSLLELETDKATVAVPSPFAGKIMSVSIAEGDTLKVGQLIGTIEASGATASPSPTASKPAPAAPAPAAPAPVAPATPVPVVTAPVASAPVATAPAPLAPKPVAPPKPAVTPAVTQAVASSLAEISDEIIPAGPAIRRFAREVGVDLSGISGSGEHGRITREDVLAIVRHQGQAATAKQPAASPASSSGSGFCHCRVPCKSSLVQRGRETRHSRNG